MKTNNKVVNIGKIDNREEEINVMKDKAMNFGKGVKATLKDKSYYKESAKGLLWGLPIGFGIELLKTRDLKKSAVVMAKRAPGSLMFGVTVAAIFNGVIAADNPEYVEYLEED